MKVLVLMTVDQATLVTNSYSSFVRCSDHRYRLFSSRNLAEVHSMDYQQSHQSVCVYAPATSVRDEPAYSCPIHVPSTQYHWCSSLSFHSSCYLNAQAQCVHEFVVAVVLLRSSLIPVEEVTMAKPTEKTHKQGAKRIKQEEKKLKEKAKEQAKQEKECLRSPAGGHQAGKHNWYAFLSCVMVNPLT